MKLRVLLIVTISVLVAMNIVSSKGNREAKEEVAGEIGYMTLFKSNIEEFDNICFNVSKPYPAYAKGAYVISAVGMFEYGERTFEGVLDGFGKLHHRPLPPRRLYSPYQV